MKNTVTKYIPETRYVQKHRCLQHTRAYGEKEEGGGKLYGDPVPDERRQRDEVVMVICVSRYQYVALGEKPYHLQKGVWVIYIIELSLGCEKV